MKKIFRHSILTAIALALFLSSCISESILPYTPGEEGYKTVSLYVTQSETGTRISRPIVDNEEVMFFAGDLYFVNAARAVVSHFSIVTGNGLPNNTERTVGRDRLLDGATFSDVPRNATYVYIIGNTTGNDRQGSIDAIINREINITNQHNAIASPGINLFGRSTLSSTNTMVELSPTVARLEIGAIEGTGSIAAFTVEGIFIDNFYSQAHISGAVIPASLWTGSHNSDAFQGGQNHFTFTGGSNNSGALFDLNVGTGQGRPWRGLEVMPRNNGNDVWAYQVFAQTDTPTLPRVVVRLNHIELINNRTISGVRYLTLSTHQFYKFGTNDPISAITAGWVYHIPVIRFNENDLALVPNRPATELDVDPQVIVIPHTGGERTLTVRTNEGWQVNRGDAQNWANATIGGTSILGVPQLIGNTFTVAVQPNTTGAQRTTTFTVSTPTGASQTITVIQLADAPMSVVRDAFVGAFWRNNQRGERLIRMPNPGGGVWSAVTTEDWIVVDRDLTPAVAGNEATTSPESRLLPGNAGRAVSHTGSHIYFRIGLTSTLPPGAMPRYGQVVVTYGGGTGTHIIWVRQGERADYLMRPIDRMTITGHGVHIVNEPRPAAARFSPFNIITPNAQNGTMLARTGQKVDYPSQAGSLFPWGHHTDPMIRAWSPIPQSAPPGWLTIGRDTQHFWAAIRGISEACPIGYRRPHDGAIDVVHPNTSTYELRTAELRQSLIHNPPIGITATVAQNAVPGFLADGFFDRRPITAEGAVEADDNRRVAFRGTLFFNPYSGASVFIPFVGWRNNQGLFPGHQPQGRFGVILSGTRNTGAPTYSFFDLQMSMNDAQTGVDTRIGGRGTTQQSFSLRCVRYAP